MVLSQSVLFVNILCFNWNKYTHLTDKKWFEGSKNEYLLV